MRILPMTVAISCHYLRYILASAPSYLCFSKRLDIISYCRRYNHKRFNHKYSQWRGILLLMKLLRLIWHKRVASWRLISKRIMWNNNDHNSRYKAEMIVILQECIENQKGVIIILLEVTWIAKGHLRLRATEEKQKRKIPTSKWVVVDQTKSHQMVVVMILGCSIVLESNQRKHRNNLKGNNNLMGNQEIRLFQLIVRAIQW